MLYIVYTIKLIKIYYCEIHDFGNKKIIGTYWEYKHSIKLAWLIAQFAYLLALHTGLKIFLVAEMFFKFKLFDDRYFDDENWLKVLIGDCFESFDQGRFGLYPDMCMKPIGGFEWGTVCYAEGFVRPPVSTYILIILVLLSARETNGAKLPSDELMLNFTLCDCMLLFLTDRTPLYLAVSHVRVGVVNELLNWGADCNAQNRRGNTPLHKAVELDSRKVRLFYH